MCINKSIVIAFKAREYHFILFHLQCHIVILVKLGMGINQKMKVKINISYYTHSRAIRENIARVQGCIFTSPKDE